MMRRIEFATVAPSYCPEGASLRCPARIDDAPASYRITAEALEDHFGARSCRYEDMLAAYERHRPEIEAVARDIFDLTGARHIVLHSGHFRFALQERSP